MAQSLSDAVGVETTGACLLLVLIWLIDGVRLVRVVEVIAP
jgi:hypothetical protein